MCEKQVSVDSRTKIYLETALINYANSGNCDIMYIPRCVGKVIICRIKTCSRYNVLSAAVPGPKATKAGRSPAGDRQTEGAHAFCFGGGADEDERYARLGDRGEGQSDSGAGEILVKL